MLIAARALQGLAGAVLTPAALAIIVAVFPKAERGAAIGKWTAYGGIGILIGPLLGGQIVDVASWRWIFALNLPLVALALFLAARAVPGAGHRAGRRASTGAAPGCRARRSRGSRFALIEQPVLGWARPACGARWSAASMFGVAFVRHEARTRRPDAAPRRSSRAATSRSANAQTFGMYGGIGILGFFRTIYLQQVAGYPALKAGVTGLVPTIVMFLFSRASARSPTGVGPRMFLTAGPLVVAAGCC